MCNAIERVLWLPHTGAGRWRCHQDVLVQMFFDQIAKSTTVNELDTAVLGESGDSRPFGYLLKDRVLDVDDFLDTLRRVLAVFAYLHPV